MAYQMAATAVTLNDLEGHSLVADREIRVYAGNWGLSALEGFASDSQADPASAPASHLPHLCNCWRYVGGT